MKILAFALVLGLSLPVLATPATEGPFKCHSQLFTQANRKLDRMLLTKAQKDSIATYAATFHSAWRETHSKVGCSAHERHAEEYIAAAAGVLTDKQFQQFRGRGRTEVESTRHQLWQASSYADDLLKLAKR